MSTQEQQQEQQLVRGQVSGIIQKNIDTWQIAVTPEGSQYAKNLWTKDAALVNDMGQRIGQSFDFLCNVSHWTRQDGQSVRSLWANVVGAFGTLSDPQPQQAQSYQQPQPQQQYQQPQQQQSTTTTQPQQQQPAMAAQIPQEVKEMRIMRQTAMKVAAALLPYLPPEQRNLSGLQVVAEWQVRYYTGGPQAEPWQEQPQNGPTQQGGSEDYWGNPTGDPSPQEGQYASDDFPPQ